MADSRFVISPAWLGGLSSLIPGEKSPLSPLRIPNPPRPTPVQLVEMEESGLLDAGDLTEPARLMLAALSEAPSFGRLRITAPTGFLDEAIHFNGEAQTVGISNTAAGLVLTSPGDVDQAFAQITDFTGSSTRAVLPWSVTLPPLEMLALAALLDLRRKAVLRAMPDAQPLLPPPGDPSSLAAAIQSMWSDPQWLTASVQTIGGLPAAPAGAQLQAALNALVQKKLAWQQNGTYIPANEAIQVADRFLLINTIITLDTGNSNVQGRVILVRQAWLQSLISEMLHVSLADDQITLQVVTPISALDKIRYFLTTFDALPAPQLEIVPLSLVIQAGVGAGQVYAMGDETVLGRSEQAQIHILDSRASRRHSVIRKLAQGYQLNDAGSTNGTYLNGQFVTSPTWINEGDEIAIGETRLKVIRPGAVPVGIVESESTVFVSGSPRLTLEPHPPEPATPRPTLVEESAAPVMPPEPEMAPAPVMPPMQSVFEPELPQNPIPESLPDEPAPAPEFQPSIVPLSIPPAPEIPPAPVSLPAPFEAFPAHPGPVEDFILAPCLAAQPVLCARCHEPLQPGAPACIHCGLPVDGALVAAPPTSTAPDPVCPNCANPVVPGARFCGACGFKLIA